MELARRFQGGPQHAIRPAGPPIRREHVANCYHRRPVWLVEKNLGPERIRGEAARMEKQMRSPEAVAR